MASDSEVPTLENVARSYARVVTEDLRSLVGVDLTLKGPAVDLVESDAVVLAECGNSFAWANHCLRFATPGRYRASTLLGASGHMVLPPGLEPLTEPVVIIAAVFMYCVEFFADKVPGVTDSGTSASTLPANPNVRARAI